jgi:uncharacterized protein YjbI with pentapeptide repeats
MTEFEQGAPQEAAAEKFKKMTREEVEARLARGENLENLDMKDLELAGLDFEGKSFRGSDIRGVCFYGEKQGEDGKTVEIPANLRRADFTDTTIGDFGPEAIFGRVEAEGATFGFSEDLISRRKRHAELKKSGERPGAADSGGLYNFNGGGGNFKKTRWANIDFGGGSGYEAIFPGANLSEGEIIGSDLAEINFSTTKIDNIKIKDPLSLRGLVITEQQTDTLANAIELSNEKERSEFAGEIKQKGLRRALEDYFGIVISEQKK